MTSYTLFGQWEWEWIDQSITKRYGKHIISNVQPQLTSSFTARAHAHTQTTPFGVSTQQPEHSRYVSNKYSKRSRSKWVWWLYSFVVWCILCVFLPQNSLCAPLHSIWECYFDFCLFSLHSICPSPFPAWSSRIRWHFCLLHTVDAFGFLSHWLGYSFSIIAYRIALPQQQNIARTQP